MFLWVHVNGGKWTTEVIWMTESSFFCLGFCFNLRGQRIKEEQWRSTFGTKTFLQTYFIVQTANVIFCSFGLKKIVWFFVCYINLIVARFIILLPGLYTTTQKVESCSIKNPIQKVRNIFQTTLSTLPTYLTGKKFSDSSYFPAP